MGWSWLFLTALDAPWEGAVDSPTSWTFRRPQAASRIDFVVASILLQIILTIFFRPYFRLSEKDIVVNQRY